MQKLEAEIQSIRKPIYKTRAFYQAMVPIVLAISGLILTWSSGWFDSQRKEVNNSKLLNQIEAIRQRGRIVILENSLASLRTEKIKLEAQSADLQRQTNELNALIVAQRFETSELFGREMSTRIQKLQEERAHMVAEVIGLRASNEKFRSILREVTGSLPPLQSLSLDLKLRDAGLGWSRFGELWSNSRTQSFLEFLGEQKQFPISFPQDTR